MSTEEPKPQGIPTKAIHESYLELQQTHRQFRQIRENDGDVHHGRAVFQDAVLTFYELLRPHLKHESSLWSYWDGELPDYTGWDFDTTDDAAEYIRDKGTGVYQVQEHVVPMQINQQMLTDGGLENLNAWHEYLELSWDTERIVSVDYDMETGYHFARLLRIAVLPLRELDHWRAQKVKERKQGDGFMAGETTVDTRLEFQPQQKIIVAKRLLVEAADKLGALSEFDASTQRTELTREDFGKVEEWRQKQLQQ